jgi:orotate phosphoribosyltransferase-like protein
MSIETALKPFVIGDTIATLCCEPVIQDDWFMSEVDERTGIMSLIKYSQVAAVGLCGYIVAKTFTFRVSMLKPDGSVHEKSYPLYKDRPILIIDDVIGTGLTLGRAALLLRKNGFQVSRAFALVTKREEGEKAVEHSTGVVVHVATSMRRILDV